MKRLKHYLTLLLTFYLLTMSNMLCSNIAAQEKTSENDTLLSFQSLIDYEEALKSQGLLITQDAYDKALNGRDYSTPVYSMPNTQDVSTNETTNDTYFSTTNLQESEVDEEDTFKNDGRYLYKLVNNQKIAIIDTQDNLKMVGQIENYYLHFSGMFLDGNKLIVLGTDTSAESRQFPYATQQSTTATPIQRHYTIIRIYDITDKTSPKLTREIAVEGQKNATRKIGDSLYVVTSKQLFPRSLEAYSLDDFIPIYKDSQTGSVPTALGANCLYIAPWTTIDSYSYSAPSANTLFCIDLTTKEAIKASSFIDYRPDVYMNTDAIYFANSNRTSTYISRFNVSSNSLSYAGTAKCKGSLYNEFAMSAYKDTFRVATTSRDLLYQTQNNLYTFDANMQPLGKLENLATDERIYSVRFVEDRCYLVTYRQIDPLFTIDLSQPQAPKVLGQLKIPGVSTYLHPLTENLVVGIGMGSEDVTSTNLNSIKLSLFDISNDLNPTEINHILLGTYNAYSPALYNHKAVAVHEPKKLLAIPVSIYSNNEETNHFFGAYVFGLENGKLVGKAKLGRINNTGELQSNYSSFNSYDRVCFIGDKLYFIYDNKVNAYELSNFHRIETLTLS